MSSKVENPGKYAATVKSAFFDQTPKGTEYLGIEFETADGLGIIAYLWLSTDAKPGKKSAFDITDETLKKAFGFNGDYEKLDAQIKGKPAHIEVAEDEYNGKKSLKVLFINAPRVEMADKGSFLKRLSAKSAERAAGTSTDGNPF